MSVEKGVDWGERGRPPSNLAVFDDSAAAADYLSQLRRANRPLPPISIQSGDLIRTLGGPTCSDITTADEALHVTIDLGAALLDGVLHWFLDHLVVRGSWLRGRVVVVANAAFLGPWNIAPRAHPGDGRLDTLDTTAMGLGDRLKARSRLVSGSHLPHPDITTRRVTAAQFDFDRPTPARLDGRSRGKARTISVRIEPDAVDLWL